jgi:hypothetical protein
LGGRDKEVAVRKVIASEFVSLDGVVEDPGGAEGSKYGSWSFAYFDEELQRVAETSALQKEEQA